MAILLICASVAMATFASIKGVRAPGDAWIGVRLNLHFPSAILGQNFTFTVNASNVDAMAAWQVFLKYNLTVMNVTDLWVPVDNIFGDPALVSQFRAVPEYGIDCFDGMGYVGFGNALYVGNVSVTDGVLFKANCTALGEGPTSILIANKTNPAYKTPDQYDGLYSKLFIFDDQLQTYLEIPQPLRVQDGAIEVIPEFPSAIVLPAFMSLVLAATVFAKRKQKSKPK